MTALWTPVPLWLSLDGGVRSLPAPARVALYELAVNGGGARCGDDPSEALDGLCAGAGASLGAMLARRVVAVEGGRLRLVAPDGAAPARGAAEAPPPPGTDAPKTDDRAASNRLGALWSKAGCRTPETRAAWVDSAAGVAFLAREGRDRAWAVERANLANSARQPAANSSPTPPTVGGQLDANPSPTTPLPPTPPLSEKNEERSGVGAREGGANFANSDGANSANPTEDGGANPPPTPPTSLRPTEDRPDAIGAADVLFELRGAGLRLSAMTSHAAELNRALADVTPVWTRESVRRLASHIRDGHLRGDWKPTFASLRGKDASWTTLLSLHDEAHGCERCNGGGDDASDPWVIAAAKQGIKL